MRTLDLVLYYLNCAGCGIQAAYFVISLLDPYDSAIKAVGSAGLAIMHAALAVIINHQINKRDIWG